MQQTWIWWQVNARNDRNSVPGGWQRLNRNCAPRLSKLKTTLSLCTFWTRVRDAKEVRKTCTSWRVSISLHIHEYWKNVTDSSEKKMMPYCKCLLILDCFCWYAGPCSKCDEIYTANVYQLDKYTWSCQANWSPCLRLREKVVLRKFRCFRFIFWKFFKIQLLNTIRSGHKIWRNM